MIEGGELVEFVGTLLVGNLEVGVGGHLVDELDIGTDVGAPLVELDSSDVSVKILLEEGVLVLLADLKSFVFVGTVKQAEENGLLVSLAVDLGGFSSNDGEAVDGVGPDEQDATLDVYVPLEMLVDELQVLNPNLIVLGAKNPDRLLAGPLPETRAEGMTKDLPESVQIVTFNKNFDISNKIPHLVKDTEDLAFIFTQTMLAKELHEELHFNGCIKTDVLCKGVRLAFNWLELQLDVVFVENFAKLHSGN